MPDARAQRLALEQFHHCERNALLGTGIMERKNVRMGQRGDGLGFAIEPRQSFGSARAEFGKNLYRNFSLEPRIARSVDLAHAAGPERSDDFVASQPGASLEGHRTGT